MVSSSTHSFLLLFPLLQILFTVDSGSVPTTAAPAATEEKYKSWCHFGPGTPTPSCIKLIESVPGIQEVEEKEPGKVAELCLHLAANKTTEAKGAADTLLAAAKGKPASSCLKVCAANINSMAEVLVNPPTGQDDLKPYLTFIKGVRAKFKHQRPPACEKDCWNKTSSSSSADETSIVDKFHDIWTLVKIGNYQLLNCFLPEDDDGDDLL